MSKPLTIGINNMTMLARFIYRGSGKEDGLFIGSSVRGQQFFEPNTVYEIVEFLGETMIRKVGKSIIRETAETNNHDLELPYMSWSWTINDIISEGGRELWLTREEYENVMKAREAQ